MLNLKQLLDTEPKELGSWYQKFRSNIIHLLESIEIDSIFGMPCFRLLVAKEYEEFAPLFTKLAPPFTHKDIYGSSSDAELSAQSDSDDAS